MARVLLFLFIISFPVSGIAQNENIFFSEAIAMHLPKYASKAQKAYRANDLKRADFLFDSLVNNCLKGKYLDNFKVRNLKNKVVSLENISKPLYLMTNASWLVPTEGEIPAFNELAAKHHDEIDFVVLFWDNRKTAKALSKHYHKSVKVFFVDELENESNYIVRNLKHSLGVPTSFLLDEDKKIVDIKRKVTHAYGLELEKSREINRQAFSEGISKLLILNSTELSEHSSKEEFRD